MKKKIAENAKIRKAKSSKQIDRLYSVYLYYFSTDLKIYEWFDPDDPIANPEARITQLALNAFNEEKNPPYYTNNHKLLKMRRKGYVAFVVNGDDWKFDQASNIEFTGPGPYGQKPGTHTFSDDYTFTIEVGSNVRLLVAYVKNTMQRVQGPIQGNGNLQDNEYESFTISLPFVSRGGGRRAPDSGGTNMGPPVPPPTRKKTRRAKKGPPA